MLDTRVAALVRGYAILLVTLNISEGVYSKTSAHRVVVSGLTKNGMNLWDFFNENMVEKVDPLAEWRRDSSFATLRQNDKIRRLSRHFPGRRDA